MFLLRIIFTSIILLLATATFSKQYIPIVTSEGIYNEYLCLVDERDIATIKFYGGPCSKRVTVEILLIQQMLALGGFEHAIKLEPGYYNLKERKLIKSGLLLISIDSVWRNEAEAMKEDVYISPPLIRKNEYVAGFYSIEDNINFKNITSLTDIRKLAIVSSKHWTSDWEALNNALFTKVIHEPIWTAQAKMVNQNLADAMLLPFSNKSDMSYQFLDKVYKPIPNFLLRIPDSRHIIIAKKHPLGQKAYQALVTGMAILRENGVIVKAFQEAGLLNPNTEKWQQVNQ